MLQYTFVPALDAISRIIMTDFDFEFQFSTVIGCRYFAEICGAQFFFIYFKIHPAFIATRPVHTLTVASPWVLGVSLYWPFTDWDYYKNAATNVGPFIQ